MMNGTCSSCRMVAALGDDGETGNMKRYIMKNAMPTEVDNQGRISISADHRDFAGLKKEISFIGMRKYVEIWGSDTADEETGTYDIEKFKSLAKGLGLS